MIVRSKGGSTIRLLWRDSVYRVWGEEHAAQLLAPFKADAAAMADLRRLLAERDWQFQASRLKDDDVIKQVARLLASGELLAGVEWRARISAPKVGEAAAPAPSGSQAPQRAAEQEPEGPTFESNHDGGVQAAALASAADSGVPFCEECARAAQAGGSQ